jgi:uncharacterized protein with von Willebrand factor type A (vWA) domain
MNTIDIKTATTAQLIAFYNAAAESPVKKFQDRATAERRVAALIEQLGWNVPKTSSRRSDGVAASWNDAQIAAKRSQRANVEVNGVLYRSVRHAFVELGFPLKEHIEFRMLLKQHGQLDNYGMTWKIVPLNY